MPLDKPSLQAGIEALNNELFVNAAGLDPSEASARHAERLAELIEIFVKSGDGLYQAGTLTAGATAVTNVGAAPVAVKIQ